MNFVGGQIFCPLKNPNEEILMTKPADADSQSIPCLRPIDKLRQQNSIRDERLSISHFSIPDLFWKHRPTAMVNPYFPPECRTLTFASLSPGYEYAIVENTNLLLEWVRSRRFYGTTSLRSLLISVLAWRVFLCVYDCLTIRRLFQVEYAIEAIKVPFYLYVHANESSGLQP
jgi:hypothetical protein